MARPDARAMSGETVEVTGETTLAAARRLVKDGARCRVAALNFASARNPGGGFLSGSQAQEESLARSSALFASLEAAGDYYAANRANPSKLYTDHAVLSPRVPVFRDDSGALLDEPYYVTFVTMPAVNVGAIPRRAAELARVESVMARRIECVLALAAQSGHRAIVLGAWGCGVFRNEPNIVARLFASALSGASSWRPYFDRVVFAVFDPSPDRSTLSAFEHHLGQL